MKILFYTFKNFPWKSKFQDVEFFEFNKLKEDLLYFKTIYNETMPKYIVGIAKGRKTSYFETKAENIFNKNKKVNKFGKDSYKLMYPTKGFGCIKLNYKYTDSFCNWTMYKISETINNSKSYLQFIHITEPDIRLLQDYIKTL